ncbi:cardiomyopathy-associated protein 5 [Austrofundulus limnaeus]|uniref:Cardiomyopathy-associated protein 5 n=1 Tax=Austrofundulus limnaeus TaxID=52670 RepID=A0A2I4C729_AUSLI|nr:PREDICTED: cardiomyopathy-associated protein 5-like [Austrofundulus limnaeus]
MEDFTRSDVDAEMTMLTSDDVTGQSAGPSDEVEILQNSLREAVHDDNIQPKMQCLMMDASFSMVTVQGEDSGIAWETTPSVSSTSWASEATDVSPASMQAAAPGSQPAGKIIFVMDEEMISRQRKTKEKESSQKSKAEKQDILAESFGNFSGRPELVEVSQPNVKVEGEEDEEVAPCPLADKEQCLFSIVSEGSEILNIVVPPKLATVDEEESKEMLDNLSYLEDSSVPKATEDTQDNELLISTESEMEPSNQLSPPHRTCPGTMDPPGAPVARPPGRGATGNLDYFEAFSLIDAQAPGSPAVIAHQESVTEATTDSRETEKPMQFEDHAINKSVNNDKLDTVSLQEITSELLDDVFYGGTDNYPIKSLDSTDELGPKGPKSRLPSKPSGSSLFSSQEDILTPIFLPEGPPKIIDPILLEEPKAMAFLYTDLYEEALGSWKKDEDTESMTSEKSFHSRHSDREARGYLEKYALIDETPAVEVEQPEKEKCPAEEDRILPQDLLDFEDALLKSEKDMRRSEEVTDFFRSSANSSPCDIDPFPRTPEDNDTQTKSETKTQKRVSIAVEKVTETPVDLLESSSFVFPSEKPDWDITDHHPLAEDERRVSICKDEEKLKQGSETNMPAVPPRRKAASSTKGCLDLTPLTPVDGISQEKEEVGGKEQRVEEKETASPVETADEGDGDGEENVRAISEVTLQESTLAELKTGSAESESVKACNKTTVQDAKPAEKKDAKTSEEEGRSEMETAAEQTGLEETDDQSDVKTELIPEKQEDCPTTASVEPAKNKWQCFIL